MKLVVARTPGVAAHVLYDLKTKLAALQRIPVGRPRPDAPHAILNSIRSVPPQFETMTHKNFLAEARMYAGNQKV